jgi:hypothetical protein
LKYLRALAARFSLFLLLLLLLAARARTKAPVRVAKGACRAVPAARVRGCASCCAHCLELAQAPAAPHAGAVLRCGSHVAARSPACACARSLTHSVCVPARAASWRPRRLRRCAPQRAARAALRRVWRALGLGAERLPCGLRFFTGPDAPCRPRTRSHAIYGAHGATDTRRCVRSVSPPPPASFHTRNRSHTCPAAHI